jgi:hypothetical protein
MTFIFNSEDGGIDELVSDCTVSNIRRDISIDTVPVVGLLPCLCAVVRDTGYGVQFSNRL